MSQPTIQFLVILKVAKYIADLQRSLFTITHSVTVDNHHGLEHYNRMIGSQPIIFKIVLSYLYSISFAGSTGEGSSLGKCQTSVFTEEEIRSVSWNLWPITFTSHIFFISQGCAFSTLWNYAKSKEIKQFVICHLGIFQFLPSSSFLFVEVNP